MIHDAIEPKNFVSIIKNTVMVPLLEYVKL